MRNDSHFTICIAISYSGFAHGDDGRGGRLKGDPYLQYWEHLEVTMEKCRPGNCMNIEIVSITCLSKMHL